MSLDSPIFIAVSSCNANVDINFSRSQRLSYVSDAYVRLISDYGAVPLIIPSNIGIEHIDGVASICHGLLLLGGPDISSDLSCAVPGGTIDAFNKSDSKRDDFELALYKSFVSYNKPVLGICRGMQIINVAHGGTLVQNLDTSLNHYIESDGWINYHEIKIVTKTKVYELMNCDKYVTSSIHHQGIDKLGDKLKVAAYSEDGVIEMIESEDKNRFVIGIQGHPEKTRTNLPKYETIFSEFIKTAGKHNEQ